MAPTTPDDPDLISTRQAARLLAVTTRTINRYVEDERLHPLWLPGGQRRYRRADVMALLSDRAVS